MMPTQNETPLFNFLNNIFSRALEKCQDDASREKVRDAIRYYADAFKSFNSVDFSSNDFSELKNKLVSELDVSLIQYSKAIQNPNVAERPVYDVYLEGLVRDLFEKKINPDLKNKFPELYREAREAEVLLHNRRVELLNKIQTAAQHIADNGRIYQCKILISSCRPAPESVYYLAKQRAEFFDDLSRHLNLHIDNVPTVLLDTHVDSELIADLSTRITLLKTALKDIDRARIQFSLNASFNRQTNAVETLNEMRDKCSDYIKKYSNLWYKASTSIDHDAIIVEKGTFDESLLTFINKKKEYFYKNEKNGLAHSFSNVVNRIFHRLLQLLSPAYREIVDVEFKRKREKVCDILEKFGAFNQPRNDALLCFESRPSAEQKIGR